MAGLKITITDAGRAALPNGPNTGTSAVTISHVGISNVHTAGSLKGLTTLPGEIKRVTTFGGDVVADDVIHVTINDETPEVYSVRAFGLYLSTGVLFAVFSSPDVVVEKSAGAMVLLSADITFKTLDTAVIEFGGTGFINPPATTERVGVVELATWEESAAGNRADVAVTPFGLLKTLQSWATNFAAAVHGHTMTSIDGLPEALAGKSATGHKHDASDTTSGVFDVGRIPALGMEKITGLATALASKAAAIHGHVMADVDGLVQALAGKSPLGHKHDASDTNSGVFDVGRIPALAMEKITGLASALAAKASLGANVYFALVGIGSGRARLYSDANTNNLIARTGPDGDEKYFQFGDDGAFRALSGPVHSSAGRVWDPSNFNPSTKATLGESVTFQDVRAFRGNGTGAVYLGDLSHYLHYDGVNYVLPNAPLVLNGGMVWTTANFDPSDKVSIYQTNLGRTGGGPVVKMNTFQDYGDVATGWSAMLHPDSAYAPGGWGYFMKAGRRDNGNGWGGLFFGRVTEANTKPDLWVGMAITRDHQPYWAKLWSDANLLAASSSEAVAGAASDRFITPAALWSFARNLGSPAYVVIPGTGLMIQCGVVSGNFPEGQAHATLPVAFGGGCIAAVAIPQNPTSTLASNYFMQVVSKHLDRIVFYANRSDSSSGNINGFEWVAIGRVSGSPDPAYSSGGGGGGGGEIDPYV
jgi:hypothetical protein